MGRGAWPDGALAGGHQAWLQPDRLARQSGIDDRRIDRNQVTRGQLNGTLPHVRRNQREVIASSHRLRYLTIHRRAQLPV